MCRYGEGIVTMMSMYCGSLLTDINECNHSRHPKVGHYCPADAKCVNTHGGFLCECEKENYEFIDKKGHTSVCQGTYPQYHSSG